MRLKPGRRARSGISTENCSSWLPSWADEGAVAFESLTLEHEGWEREYEIAQPQETAFTEPPG